MTTMEVAKALMAFCAEGKYKEAMDALYDENIISVEASAPPGESAEVRGIAATKAKGEWWQANHDVHSAELNGPWPNGDRFIVNFKYDITFKPTGQRMMMDEMALYQVANGKIVREDFFYAS
jgi:ketosteroid isomerase-like protein